MYGHVLYFIFPAIGGAVHINSIGQFWPVLASFSQFWDSFSFINYF